jgi:hypothetical protein
MAPFTRWRHVRALTKPVSASRCNIFIVNYVLCDCAAYPMQLFLYLKASGREELSSWNLRAGVDAPAAAV